MTAGAELRAARLQADVRFRPVFVCFAPESRRSRGLG